MTRRQALLAGGVSENVAQWLKTWLTRWRVEFGGNDEPDALRELAEIVAATKRVRSGRVERRGQSGATP